jgi:hypothetical protein
MKHLFETLLLAGCLCAACSKQVDHQGKTVLVEVAGQYLYQEDLTLAAPAGLSKEDSVLFAENYIHNWIEDALLYRRAEQNVPDNQQIDKLVEHYRRALVMHTYQQNLIAQKLSAEITDEEIQSFYEKNLSLFVLDAPLIKGLFIKVPLKQAGVNKVRSWYKSNTTEAVENLEKYSLRGAVDYSYFYDRWVPVAEVADKIPFPTQEVGEYLKQHRAVELKDNDCWYFLHVSEYLASGQVKPLEVARTEIREILVNLKQVDFMQKVKDDLFDRASKKNEITYYYLENK